MCTSKSGKTMKKPGNRWNVIAGIGAKSITTLNQGSARTLSNCLKCNIVMSVISIREYWTRCLVRACRWMDKT